MKKWLVLIGAIVTEVIGTMALRATIDDPVWIPLVIVAYAIAFTLLGLTLRYGMPLGVAYGTWGAGGVALTAILGAVLFGEILSPLAIVGILVIIAGVLLVETGAPAPETSAESKGVES